MIFSELTSNPPGRVFVLSTFNIQHSLRGGRIFGLVVVLQFLSHLLKTSWFSLLARALCSLFSHYYVPFLQYLIGIIFS